MDSAFAKKLFVFLTGECDSINSISVQPDLWFPYVDKEQVF
jgi:predicted metalloprotease